MHSCWGMGTWTRVEIDEIDSDAVLNNSDQFNIRKHRPQIDSLYRVCPAKDHDQAWGRSQCGPSVLTSSSLEGSRVISGMDFVTA